ncbi:MAG: hypothetical protein A2992_09215 [Elusimicrobia bacterium RIFCSPLOWO2_01_FULL_59_12]|nr:MAG: hypothetical protein A2992_09215 [Elusimicrobia bacterium RIFCSPLOWO2_01_FULL_59_12]
MEPKTYRNPSDFRRALETRLASEAEKGPFSLPRLRLQVTFERFLARLFQDPEPDFLLKGGYGLELRLRHRARFSKDIDLTTQMQKTYRDPETARMDLQAMLQADLKDGFSFRIGSAARTPDGAPYAGFRFPIQAVVAGRTFALFNIDVASGDAITGDPEWVQGQDLLKFAGIAPAHVALVPRETHFAEKIHAYTLPRSRPNSRVKDLVDLMLLLEDGFNEREHLRLALESTFTRRDTHPLPKVLEKPESSWGPIYTGIAAEIALSSAPTAEEAYRRLSTFWNKLFNQSS